MREGPASPARLYRFGLFEADPGAAELRKAGRRIKLRGRPLDLLIVLVERAGEVVSREELRQRLWPADTFVDFDRGLNTSANRLREALGDSAENPRFIETIPRRGYRWIAPVTIVEREPAPLARTAPPSPVGSAAPDGSAAPQQHFWRWSTAGLYLALLGALAAFALLLRRELADRSPPIQRIAVLPFRSMSDDPEQEYFVDGMTDALIAELAQIRSLRVISRTSVMPYRRGGKPLTTIARELGVGAVVEGAALKAGMRVRITAQLIEGASDRHLWAGSYERDLADVIMLQREVAHAIAQEIRATLTTQEQARLGRSTEIDPRAYDLYLRGRFLREQLTESALLQAIALFRQAIEIDPRYAQAYAGLADCTWILGTAGIDLRPQSETAPRALGFTEQALALDPELPGALATRAMIQFEHDWDFEAAERGLRRAIDMNPSFSRAQVWYSGLLTALGRHQEAIAAARRGLELDPLSPIASQTLAVRYYYAGDLERARSTFRQTLDLEPRAYVARLGLGQCLWRQGRCQPAIAEIERALAGSMGSDYVQAWLGLAWACAGAPERSRAILAELQRQRAIRYLSPFHLALLHLALGEREAALEQLEACYRERSGWMTFLAVEPELEPLRAEPRFRELMRKVGLIPG